MQKYHFSLVKQLKNTTSAQLSFQKAYRLVWPSPKPILKTS